MTLRVVASKTRRDDAILHERLRALLRQPGEPLSERSLAEQLGVTRHRLRLVLGRLRDSGEIDAPAVKRPPGGATSTREPNGRDTPRREGMIRGTNPVEVIELRIMLEPALARLAAVRATPLDIARIERAATTATGQEQGAADVAFHSLVAAGSGNALARDLYALLRGVGADVRLRVSAHRPGCSNRLRQRDAEHRAIAAAIVARDPDAAEAAMRAHLGAVRQRVLDRLTPGLGAA